MNAGRFRSDLFFRIAQVRNERPPWRERRGDVPLLVEPVCRDVRRPEHVATVLAWIQRHRASYDAGQATCASSSTS